ncbi:hypothetical protein [Endozoicomonas atrinae]|uniref:hypothetical protein n=1 Tax=Endozoicomonas atrinae TaxID=1333660 RepID=UPI0008258F27|nr:hypothetical protein [Endozoicomonas atrinae]
METAHNVVALESARQPEPHKASDLFDQVWQKAQADAIDSDIEQQVDLLKTVQLAYKSLRKEKAKFIVALLNPFFFQQALESIEGAQKAVLNYWALGDGLFFYRHFIGCQIGKYSQEILFKDELSDGQLMNIGLKLNSSVKWAEGILQGEGVK